MRISGLFLSILFLLLFSGAGFSQPAFADEVNLKKGKSSGNDADLANIYSVRKDYFLRFPFAKMAEEMKVRELDRTKEQKESHYELPSWGLSFVIPPGPLLTTETKKAEKPEPYFPVRPQYRPLYSYCSGAPGAFFPPSPGMTGNFIPNYSKIAKGQGGGVQILPPVGPTCYVQPPGLTAANGPNQAQEGDQAIFEYELTTFGVGPISDTQFQMIDRQDNQRFLELMFDPERWLWSARAAGIMQQQQMATNMANTADIAESTAVDTLMENLINVANENAAESCDGNIPKKKRSHVVYMVQEMYKQVFVPMALLILLPGAVITQMKGMVQFGVLNSSDDDAQSPFSGIIRSIIAIFLIPASQLIVSYMIDVGNSMANEVKPWINPAVITGYAHEQQYGAQRDMTTNVLSQESEKPQEESRTNTTTAILGAQSSGGQDDIGKAYGGPEKKSVEEHTYQLSKQMQLIYNVFNVGAAWAIEVLCEFQWVMISYLFLLGPLAGAFYAWPNVSKGSGGGPGLFNKVFTNWLEAVFMLCLWRFWWNVVLACETTYILWMQDKGWFYPNSDWELMVYTSFQVLLLSVPVAPFAFNAQEQVKQIEKDKKDKVDKGETGK